MNVSRPPRISSSPEDRRCVERQVDHHVPVAPLVAAHLLDQLGSQLVCTEEVDDELLRINASRDYTAYRDLLSVRQTDRRRATVLTTIRSTRAPVRIVPPFVRR